MVLNSSEGIKVAVVFRELAPYILACFRETARLTGHTLRVFCLPVNAEAPFDFGEQPGLEIINRSGWNSKQLYEAIAAGKPDLVFVADWTNPAVLLAAFRLRRRCTVITGFDNHWKGGWKQRLFSFGASIVFPRIFRGVFIPGEPQREMAHRMGFRDKDIRTGAYSADTALFDGYYERTFSRRMAQFPHRLLCVARYIPAKGLDILWEAFIQAKQATGSDWELWCAGTGEGWEQRREHPAIRHLGFLQPQQLESVIAETGVFVLPSLFEPWGVVVHEYARAGFPLVLSRDVGAASQFLAEGRNGFAVPAGDVHALRDALIKVMQCDENDLKIMAETSRAKGLELSPEHWAAQMRSFCAKKSSE
jgi:glycosyltransferase involved in cell wall biosynthesis